MHDSSLKTIPSRLGEQIPQSLKSVLVRVLGHGVVVSNRLTTARFLGESPYHLFALIHYLGAEPS